MRSRAGIGIIFCNFHCPTVIYVLNTKISRCHYYFPYHKRKSGLLVYNFCCCASDIHLEIDNQTYLLLYIYNIMLGRKSIHQANWYNDKAKFKRCNLAQEYYFNYFNYLFSSRIIEIWPQVLFRTGRNSRQIFQDKQIHSRQDAAAGFVSCFREILFHQHSTISVFSSLCRYGNVVRETCFAKFPAFKSSSKVRRDNSVTRFSREFKLRPRQLVKDILQLRLRNLTNLQLIAQLFRSGKSRHDA